MYWTTGSGRIELRITKAQAATGCHQGHCDDDISVLRLVPPIARQLQELNPELVASELKEYGAWDDKELTNHEENLNRILWIACGDIMDRQG